MEVDDIISYHDLVTEEKAALQKRMNFGVGKKYSVCLMSLRENAPYADALDQVSGMLTYEGHDEPQRRGGPNPKEVDQPLTTPRGSWTENGKFFHAAMDSKVVYARNGADQSLRKDFARDLELQRLFRIGTLNPRTYKSCQLMREVA